MGTGVEARIFPIPNMEPPADMGQAEAQVDARVSLRIEAVFERDGDVSTAADGCQPESCF